MNVTFYGTRGSIPSCGIEYVKFGGDTTCVQVVTDEGQRIIIDAGTGIRNINDIKKGEKIRIFLTHSHWDHIQGLPFFSTIYNPTADFYYYMGASNFESIKRDLTKQMSGTTFPVSFDNLPCNTEFVSIDGRLKIDENITLEVFDNAHPGKATAIKIINHKKIFTFITDNEIAILKEKNLYNDFVHFCEGSTVIVHDGQYCQKEYEEKYNWGHSSIEQVIELLITIKPKIGIFTHHDPNHNDTILEQFEETGKQMLKDAGVSMFFFGAKQKDVVEF